MERNYTGVDLPSKIKEHLMSGAVLWKLEFIAFVFRSSEHHLSYFMNYEELLKVTITSSCSVNHGKFNKTAQIT